MIRDELLHLIAEIQQVQSESDAVEVKAARQGTSRRLYEAISAFANCSIGGVLLLSLNKNSRFELSFSKQSRCNVRLIETSKKMHYYSTC